MDYKKHYDALVLRAHGRLLSGYKEKHHVLPKCMGGTDAKHNIVALTPEEHYLAHLLLLKIHGPVRGLVYAVSMMSGGGRAKDGVRCNNKLYGWCRQAHAIVQSACTKAYFAIEANRVEASRKAIAYQKSNPEKFKAQLAVAAEAMRSESARSKLSVRTKETHRERPELAAKHSLFMRARFADPVVKRLHSDAQKRRFESDSERLKNGERVSAFFASPEGVRMMMAAKGKVWLMPDGESISSTSKGLVKLFPQMNLSESGLNRIFRGEYDIYKGIKCLGRTSSEVEK